MGLVTTWLTSIGLSHHSAAFRSRGITRPVDLSSLTVSDYTALGVIDERERKKLFYLVMRIRIAVRDAKAGGGGERRNILGKVIVRARGVARDLPKIGSQTDKRLQVTDHGKCHEVCTSHIRGMLNQLMSGVIAVVGGTREDRWRVIAGSRSDRTQEEMETTTREGDSEVGLVETAVREGKRCGKNVWIQLFEVSYENDDDGKVVADIMGEDGEQTENNLGWDSLTKVQAEEWEEVKHKLGRAFYDKKRERAVSTRVARVGIRDRHELEARKSEIVLHFVDVEVGVHYGGCRTSENKNNKNADEQRNTTTPPRRPLQNALEKKNKCNNGEQEPEQQDQRPGLESEIVHRRLPQRQWKQLELSLNATKEQHARFKEGAGIGYCAIVTCLSGDYREGEGGRSNSFDGDDQQLVRAACEARDAYCQIKTRCGNTEGTVQSYDGRQRGGRGESAHKGENHNEKEDAREGVNVKCTNRATHKQSELSRKYKKEEEEEEEVERAKREKDDNKLINGVSKGRKGHDERSKSTVATNQERGKGTAATGALAKPKEKKAQAEEKINFKASGRHVERPSQKEQGGRKPPPPPPPPPQRRQQKQKQRPLEKKLSPGGSPKRGDDAKVNPKGRVANLIKTHRNAMKDMLKMVKKEMIM